MSGDLNKTVEEINELISAGNSEDAFEKVTEAMKTFGRTKELVSQQVEVLMEQEDYDSVLEVSQEAIEEFDDKEFLSLMHSQRGDAYYYMDELDDARREQNEAVHLNPESYMAIIGRAMVHEDIGFLNAAMLDLRRATALNDEEGQPWAMEASIFMRWGQMEECRDALEKAVDRDDEDLDSRLQLARFYALGQRSDDAMELLTEILDSDIDDDEDPDLFAPAALLRSQLSLTLGSTDAALEDAERAEKIISDLPWAYLQIAATKIHAQADGEGAIGALKKAESIVGNILDLPDLFSLYAAAYQMLGKEHKVRKYLEEAEGVARLPGYVYGPLNPVENIPVNPNRPIDFRRLLDDLFGDANKAPKGYEEGLRQAIQEVMKKIPEIRAENPGVERIEINLPEAPGMIGGGRSLMMELNSPPSTEEN